MTLQDLQDKLRTHIRARIDRGELTGTGLSREARFQQGHLSNFLNARRGLSLESMDRLLETLNLSVLDLADLKDIEQQVSFFAGTVGIREHCRGERGASGSPGAIRSRTGARHPQVQQVFSASAETE